jgi:prepilin-type N-terminal cleavage/methylation domain-containing protein
MKNKKIGFTLIELLVVIAIIGILATLAVVALQNSRKNARDAKRMADVKQMQTALELYFNDAGEYPESVTSSIAYGNSIYMVAVPSAPTPFDGDCTENQNNYTYILFNSSTYAINFCVGSRTGGLSEGLKVASPSGIITPPDCGDYTVTFTYNGSPVTYGTVLNSVTGGCWLDRNLGATQVATVYNDANAYGDLFQWGRADDGHQGRSSATTITLSTNDTPGHGNFIINGGSPYDWRSDNNNNRWNASPTTVNNPCPIGWRIPTEAEWSAEKLSWVTNNRAGAFASPLKLTVAGYRLGSNASLSSVGSNGTYWSSSISGTNSRYLLFYGSSADMSNNSRVNGLTVRCIKSY